MKFELDYEVYSADREVCLVLSKQSEICFSDWTCKEGKQKVEVCSVVAPELKLQANGSLRIYLGGTLRQLDTTYLRMNTATKAKQLAAKIDKVLKRFIKHMNKG